MSRAGRVAAGFSTHVLSFQEARVGCGPQLVTAAVRTDAPARRAAPTPHAENPEPRAASSDAATHRERMAAGLFLWLGLVLGLVGVGTCVLLLARQRNRK